MTEPSEIGLREYISTLRKELQDIVAEGAEESLRFEIGPIDLELKMSASKTAEGGGGIQIHIFSASGKANYKAENAQTIKLRLTPRVLDAESAPIGEILLGRTPDDKG